MLYIRADGNTTIGMGHVMRCLSIAEAAYSLTGKRPVFISADDTCLSMIESRGFEAVVLHTDYREMESELPRLSKLLEKNDSILVDSYQATVVYYRQLKNLCRVACMEDMGEPYPVDLLINYNIYGPEFRQSYEQNRGTGIAPDKVLLGVQYMPLREAFRQDITYQIRNAVTDVMITTGGSDPYFAAGALTDCLINSKEITGVIYHVVSGPFNRFTGELRANYNTVENVVIHESVQDMKALMKQCDVVITATGSTIYEVSALGVPMICFYFAENQRQGAEALARLTDIVNAGCFAENKEKTVENVCKALVRCIREKSYREKLYCQEKQLVDGNGALRIAYEILDGKVQE